MFTFSLVGFIFAAMAFAVYLVVLVSVPHHLWVFIICYILANGSLLLVSSVGADLANQPTVRQASEMLGLKSNVEYPMKLGSRNSGTVGSVKGGLFYVNGKFTPGSALSLGFDVGDSSCILEPPTNVVEFIKSDEYVNSTVEVEVIDKVDLDLEARFETKPDTVVVCDTGWWLVKPGERTGNISWHNRNDSGMTLPAIVNGNFTRITIRLTPEAYQKLLNG